MGIQRKLTASLNDERQRKLDAIVAEEPFVTPSSALAAALDMLYAAWQAAGRDLKAALGANGLTGAPAGGAA